MTKPNAPKPADIVLLTVPEAAAMLRISDSFCYQLVLSRTIPAVRMGRAVRVLLEDVEEYARSHREEARRVA